MPMDSKEKNNSSKSNIWKNPTFLVSFGHAWDGVKLILKEESNMRHHAFIALLPILFGFFFQISGLEWIALISCIFLVVMMEFVNTIFETVVDMVTDYEYHPLAKKAKDIAAGAVLVAAVFSIIVAAIIFLPKILALFF
ncbi:MAG TPA: diacylglycerol kinase family protein [Candidatus Jeotgalibaca merdavium]|uniref:Diacylglycerol kinase family protein n=1 Tax=Candidatus Jeotgalibaca merdavium TaxID=2838627 RepID=A0A9D2KYP9_9LACT|nr:diacylglycerol kinase family protein [Candidatus Jeotgalibaca merdavium]